MRLTGPADVAFRTKDSNSLETKLSTFERSPLEGLDFGMSGMRRRAMSVLKFRSRQTPVRTSAQRETGSVPIVNINIQRPTSLKYIGAIDNN